jgi:hypothetical protein
MRVVNQKLRKAIENEGRIARIQGFWWQFSLTERGPREPSEGGEPWSTSALAYALGASQRTVQRALRHLDESRAVRPVGRGRSRRWVAPPLAGFATTLLLPGALPVR